MLLLRRSSPVCIGRLCIHYIFARPGIPSVSHAQTNELDICLLLSPLGLVTPRPRLCVSVLFEFPGSIGHGPRASAHWVGAGGGKIGGEVLFHLPPMRVGVSVSVVFSWRASASSMQDDRYHDMLRSMGGRQIAQDKNEFWWEVGTLVAGSDPARAVF